jgi:hypothetical protein
MAEDRNITYLNRDFSDFRAQLIELAKNYFPDTYNDFSPTSPGMMFIEMAAYVGDVLSFYQDTQLQETFINHAKDPKNLYSLAYMMGYRPRTVGVSKATLEVTQTIDSDSANNYIPSWSQAAIISQNLTITSTDSSRTKFFLDSRIDFTFSSSYDPTEVIVNTLDVNGDPETYRLKKTAEVFSGEVIQTTFNITTTEQFKTLTIQDTDIVGILDIWDQGYQSGSQWFEVPFLGQDTVFSGSLNSLSSPNEPQEIINLKRVSKRFVTRHTSNGYLQIQFGAGTNLDGDETILPNPLNIGLGASNGLTAYDKAYDPSNFIYSRTYGLAPRAGTVLYVRYLKGGGVTANVPSNTITSPSATPVISSNGDNSRISSADLIFTNPEPASGGRDGDTVEELRQNSLRSFNEQRRTGTLQDYVVRALSLPPQFGSIAKAYAVQDQITNTNRDTSYISENNPFAIGLYVLSFDNTKKLLPSTPRTLKENLRKYLSQYIIASDSVNIYDAFVVNIGINYDIILRPNYSGRDVLLKCSNTLKEYFNVDKWSINQPINIAQIYTVLDKVTGVQTVQNVEIVNKQGGNYSQFGYDVKTASRNNIIYPSLDPSIFEVKFPDQDIKGRVTIL